MGCGENQNYTGRICGFLSARRAVHRSFHRESTDLWTTFHRSRAPLLRSWLSQHARLTRTAESKPPVVAVSALFDAVGEFGHLVEELAVLAHLRVNLLHRVHDCGVVAAPEAGSDLR